MRTARVRALPACMPAAAAAAGRGSTVAAAQSPAAQRSRPAAGARAGPGLTPRAARLCPPAAAAPVSATPKKYGEKLSAYKKYEGGEEHAYGKEHSYGKEKDCYCKVDRGWLAGGVRPRRRWRQALSLRTRAAAAGPPGSHGRARLACAPC